MKKAIDVPPGVAHYKVPRLRSMSLAMVEGDVILNDYKPPLVFRVEPATALRCLSCLERNARLEECVFFTQEDLDEHVRMHQVLDA